MGLKSEGHLLTEGMVWWSDHEEVGREDWNNIFRNTSTPGPSSKVLYADVHRAQ